jgi:two-component system, chemotaxis family, protein-glutamate methylesterase/glutaminase
MAKIEETLWVALRMFEERQSLLLTMCKKEAKKIDVIDVTRG